MGGVPSRGGLSMGSQSVFTSVSEKTTENSERLGRQARPGVEPGTSRLPIFERKTAQLLVGPRTYSLTSMLYPGIEPETFGAAAGFLSHYTAWLAGDKERHE